MDNFYYQVLHVMLESDWDLTTSILIQKQQRSSITQWTGQMRTLWPESAAYLNEADMVSVVIIDCT